jgi:phosphoribosylaminoimidazolecarboxamide formyltransferase / IMP cyclohydrolase
MNKRIKTALISVFYKVGLEPVVKKLHELGVTIYSTGGTQSFIEKLGVPVIPVEQLTSYPSILGGRVKTLHPLVFGGILGRRNVDQDIREMQEYGIPVIDLVIVDLYPFSETLESVRSENFKGSVEEGQKMVIEKIDIGGPSMIRAAAKNFSDVTVIASASEYAPLVEMLSGSGGETSLEERRSFAAKAFSIVKDYDQAISDYFETLEGKKQNTPLRYGENPHQAASFEGNLRKFFEQLHGKELSYNNLVDVEAAIELMNDFRESKLPVFAIIKHTNVCGVAEADSVVNAWNAALAGDPESAFGGVLASTHAIDEATANGINDIFFEVLVAPSFTDQALEVLRSKKNRILLRMNTGSASEITDKKKQVLGGWLSQQTDSINYEKWEESGGRNSTEAEKEDLVFANIVCKHLKSNAIALVKNKMLIGKGCGQTSRIDALKQAVNKAKQFNADLSGAVMASDAFFPFDDCVKLGHEAGIAAFIQPGGSIRDKDSVAYCKENNLAMVLTGTRHFKH